MKARTVNEAQNFERGEDPRKSMRIGVSGWSDEKVLQYIEKKLSEIGIEIYWKGSHGYEEGAYAIYISNNPELNDAIQISYINKEKAEEEWGDTSEAGFGIATWDGVIILDNTMDFEAFISAMVEEKKEYVNEAQNFERGKNPKTTLGLGGIVLEKELETRIDELEYEMAMATKAADEEYKEWLRKTFVDKTITAEMQNHPRVNPETKKTSPSKGSGEFTIKVQDMLPGDSIKEMMNKENFTAPVENQSVIVASTEGDIYSIKVRDKIYVE